MLGPGCLNFALILSLERRPELRDVRASYDKLLGALLEAFALKGLARAGPSDLACLGRKVSGNAQMRKRSSLLHHGTILYGFDLGLVDRYLPVPRLIPGTVAEDPTAIFCAIFLWTPDRSARYSRALLKPTPRARRNCRSTPGWWRRSMPIELDRAAMNQVPGALTVFGGRP